jgi:transposase, IS30 family
VPGVRLCSEQPIAIEVGIARDESLAQIARRLGRPTSTVSREVRAAAGRDCYRASLAEKASRRRSCRPKALKLVGCRRLAAIVEVRLEQRWSPAQIAHRLRVDHPDDETLRLSHETIYRSLYLQGRGGLRKELISALRTGRARRRPRTPGEKAKRANVLGPIVPISERPPEAADRAVPGHWEGDLLMGAFNRSAVVTLVERTSRFTLLGDLPDGHDAQAVYECLIQLTMDLPDVLRRSLTWDQGREIANGQQLRIDAPIEVYICDPHAPWQRPTNENTNGLIRQYLPKGTDLHRVTRAHLADIAATGTGAGYWILGADGIVRNYGDATSVGTTPVSNSPVAIAR